jgi:MscS family membrane protein
MQEIQLLNQQFLGNTLFDFAVCFIILLFGFLLKRFGATFLSKQSFRLFKSLSANQESDNLVLVIRRPFEQLLTLIVLYVAFDFLSFPEELHLKPVTNYGVRWFIFTCWLVAMFVISGRILLKATDYFAYIVSHRELHPVTVELANFVKELVKILIIIMVVFAGLNFIFHVNITALIASLGIGGLAIALAAQDTLANLLGSFIIYLDKPFRPGDTIEINDITGTVEHVGFRTTRIRTSQKSLLTVPNKKLIDNALNNITMSAARRVKFSIGLTYGTQSTQIQAVINDVKKAILEHPLISNDFTVRFDAFDSGSLNILVVYFVVSNEYDVMIEVKEELNFKMMQIVEQNGCSFALPSQTIYVKQ